MGKQFLFIFSLKIDILLCYLLLYTFFNLPRLCYIAGLPLFSKLAEQWKTAKSVSRHRGITRGNFVTTKYDDNDNGGVVVLLMTIMHRSHFTTIAHVGMGPVIVTGARG
jgi:hypothetical protein